MKKYKTWEAIKMITENNKLEFDWHNDYGWIGRLKRDNKIVDTVNCYDKNGNEVSIGLDEEWVLVQKPVNFMDAVNSCNNIRVEHEYISNLIKEGYGCLKDYMNIIGIMAIFSENFDECDLKEVILNGKWYIEKDEKN